MAMDEDTILHFEAVVLDGEVAPWTAERVTDVLGALAAVGIHPLDPTYPHGWVAGAGEAPIPFEGKVGVHELLLEPSGGWWWDTPYATLMKSRHTNRPEVVHQLVDTVRALLGTAAPYFGCTWYSNHMSPPWVRTSEPFRAEDGAAIEFFSCRYLETHCGGEPYPDPPVASELLAGGQLLVADLNAFGEATDVRHLTQYFQKHSRI